jgi:hypothetical protein
MNNKIIAKNFYPTHCIKYDYGINTDHGIELYCLGFGVGFGSLPIVCDIVDFVQCPRTNRHASRNNSSSRFMRRFQYIPYCKFALDTKREAAHNATSSPVRILPHCLNLVQIFTCLSCLVYNFCSHL